MRPARTWAHTHWVLTPSRSATSWAVRSRSTESALRGERQTATQAGSDPWLTLAEIAAELRVNPSTVRLWVSQGRLSASRAGRRKWLVRRSELERMLAAEGSVAPPIDTASADPVRPPMPGDRLIFDPGGGEGERPGG